MGRKKGSGKIRTWEADSTHCRFCEGTRLHYGAECPACLGSGKETARRALQRAYNIKEGLERTYNTLLIFN